MDGYISGDGHVTQASLTVGAGSVSEELIDRLITLLARFKIFATKSSSMPKLRKFKSVHRHYNLYIPAKFSHVFANTFTLTIGYKQALLNKCKLVNCDATCRKTEFADVVLDRVKTIHDTLPKGGKMYDVTVEKTRNFMTKTCLCQKDTFHLSGVAAKSGMTRGVPRLKELLKVTQNPKATSLTIYMRPDLRKSKEAARHLAQELEFTTLRDLVTVSRIYYDPRDSSTLISDDQEWLNYFAMFEQAASAETVATTKPKKKTKATAAAATATTAATSAVATTTVVAQSPWILRLEMNREKMFNKNITMEHIAFMLRDLGPSVHIVYTDHNSSQMIFRIRLKFETPLAPTPLDGLTTIKHLQNKILTQTLIRGLPGLRSVSFRPLKNEIYEKNPANDNKYESVDQFVLDTIGTNFMDVLIHPDVDGLKLVSNHIHDINDNLGIEAARQILFREIFGLFEQAAPVNYRHVALLCDAMCNRGRLMSADRYGVNKKKIGPLAKASFEQTEDIVLRAALFGEMDPMTGISANIMTGQPIRGGTSFTQILLDEVALAELVKNAPHPKVIVERAPVLTQDQVDKLVDADEAEDAADGCSTADLRIPIAMPPQQQMVAGASGMVDLPDMDIQIVG